MSVTCAGTPSAALGTCVALNDSRVRGSRTGTMRADPGASIGPVCSGVHSDGHRSREEASVPKQYTRLTTPLVREGDRRTGSVRPATWDEALERTVAGLRAAGASHGPQTFGIFSCSKATNEVNFAAQKFSRV